MGLIGPKYAFFEDHLVKKHRCHSLISTIIVRDSCYFSCVAAKLVNFVIII